MGFIRAAYRVQVSGIYRSLGSLPTAILLKKISLRSPVAIHSKDLVSPSLPLVTKFACVS